MEAENERLKQQLTGKPNSRNSSPLPSRHQKPNQPPDKPKKKNGPPFSHQKFSRPLMDSPDRVIQVPVTEREQCLADLTTIPPENFERRQITELPEAKPLVIETRQHRATCPHSQTLNHGLLPEGLEAERCYGPNLEATVVFYKQTQHLSYERIVETMRDLHGVSLSEGAIALILERAGKKAQPVAEAIKEQVITGEVIRSDETSARAKARNWWQYVFISEHGVYHTIVPTRSYAEIAEVMGQLAARACVSDCYGAQLKAPAEVFQLCLAHQLRNLQRVLDVSPEESWAQAARKLFRDTIYLRNRFASGEMTLNGFWRRVTQTENELDRLLEEQLENESAQTLQTRLSIHREKLVTFLHYPAVPPTNNESEQALRSSVVHRKVNKGFRSEWERKPTPPSRQSLPPPNKKAKRPFKHSSA